MGLHLLKFNPSDTKDFTEGAGKTGNHTGSHTHMQTHAYTSPGCSLWGQGAEPLRGRMATAAVPERLSPGQHRLSASASRRWHWRREMRLGPLEVKCGECERWSRNLRGPWKAQRWGPGCVWEVVAWAGLGLRRLALWCALPTGPSPPAFGLPRRSWRRAFVPAFWLRLRLSSLRPLGGAVAEPPPLPAGRRLLQELSPRGSPRGWAAPGHSRACAWGQPGALPGRRGLPFVGL